MSYPSKDKKVFQAAVLLQQKFQNPADAVIFLLELLLENAIDILIAGLKKMPDDNPDVRRQ
jgi:hypothetical protein